jgi:hypothetical protein
MRIPETSTKGQIVVHHLLNATEEKFWIEIAVEALKRDKGIMEAFADADLATLALIKRR